MAKVEVYKNSKGELFENEREYILSEAKIQRERILENWERYTQIIKHHPENFYQFIKQIGDEIIDKKVTKEDLQKRFDEVNDIFIEEQTIKLKDFQGSGEQVEYEPYLWGNDILDGYDVNR